MGNEFVSMVYERLNNIINRFGVDYERSGDINEYSNIRKLTVDDDNWWVYIECSNGYRLEIRFVDYCASKYKKKKIMTVSVYGIVIEPDYNRPDIFVRRNIKNFKVKERLDFIEGDFDISKDDWIDDTLEFMNKWVLAGPSDVEAL